MLLFNRSAKFLLQFHFRQIVEVNIEYVFHALENMERETDWFIFDEQRHMTRSPKDTHVYIYIYIDIQNKCEF
jgi:hypothetical protein